MYRYKLALLGIILLCATIHATIMPYSGDAFWYQHVCYNLGMLFIIAGWPWKEPTEG